MTNHGIWGQRNAEWGCTICGYEETVTANPTMTRTDVLAMLEAALATHRKEQERTLLAERDEARAELARLRADLEQYLEHLDDRMDDDYTLTHVSDVKAEIRRILGPDPDDA